MMPNVTRRKNIAKILPVAPFANSQRDIAAKVGITQATVSKVMNSEQFKELYEQQKRKIVDQASQFAYEWFEDQVKTSKSRSSLEAATVWAIIIDKITKLAGDDVQWKNNIQAGGNITLEVSDNVKKIMEKVKK